jgi:hypothetical protein
MGKKLVVQPLLPSANVVPAINRTSSSSISVTINSMLNSIKKTRNFPVLLLIVGILFWIILLFTFAQLQHRLKYDGRNDGSGANLIQNIKHPISHAICNEHNSNGIGIGEFQTMKKLETELNAGWNQTDRPTKVLTLGTHGYIKRDLPIYESAFSQKTMVLLPKPNDGKLHQHTDFDAVLCLSFNTESCLSKEEFSLIGRNRKINRIKSLREVLWSKNTFCDTLTQATESFPSADFFFPCWVLPEQYDKLVSDSTRLRITRWISKPRSLGAGMGITIIDSLKEIKRHSTHVVQQYMKNPHLLIGADEGKHKWDMRTYVLVTSVVPLRAYVYKRGLVRLATSPYSDDCKSHNQTACLTNTSINKKMEGAKLKDITWSFKKLKDYLTDRVYNEMFTRMQRAVGMTLLGALPAFMREWEGHTENCEFCYQLLGVDVIFDDKLNPKVIECNGEPSMQTTGGGKTHYDITKKNMIHDLVNLVYQDSSAVKDMYRSIQQLANDCVKSNANGKIKLRKIDVSYLLDFFRESKVKGDFSPVYPHPVHNQEYRKFLVHLLSVPTFSKKIQKQMKSVLQSHDLVSDFTTSKQATTQKAGSSQELTKPVHPPRDLPKKKEITVRESDDDDDDNEDDV